MKRDMIHAAMFLFIAAVCATTGEPRPLALIAAGMSIATAAFIAIRALEENR